MWAIGLIIGAILGASIDHGAAALLGAALARSRRWHVAPGPERRSKRTETGCSSCAGALAATSAATVGRTARLARLDHARQYVGPGRRAAVVHRRRLPRQVRRGARARS